MSQPGALELWRATGVWTSHQEDHRLMGGLSIIIIVGRDVERLGAGVLGRDAPSSRAEGGRTEGEGVSPSVRRDALPQQVISLCVSLSVCVASSRRGAARA